MVLNHYCGVGTYREYEAVVCFIKATSKSDDAKLVATGIMAVNVGITSFSSFGRIKIGSWGPKSLGHGLQNHLYQAFFSVIDDFQED